MADVALLAAPIAEQSSDALERLGLDEERYLLVTAHRAGNVDDRPLAGAAGRDPGVPAAAGGLPGASAHAGAAGGGGAAGTARAGRDPSPHPTAGLPGLPQAAAPRDGGADRLGRGAEGGLPRAGPMSDDARHDRVDGDRGARLEPARRASIASRCWRRWAICSARPSIRSSTEAAAPRRRSWTRSGAGPSAAPPTTKLRPQWSAQRTVTASGSWASATWACPSGLRSRRRAAA